MITALAGCDQLSEPSGGSSDDPLAASVSAEAGSLDVSTTSSAVLDVTSAGQSTFTLSASGSMSNAGVGAYDIGAPTLRDNRKAVIVNGSPVAPVVPQVSRVALNSSAVASAVVDGSSHSRAMDTEMRNAFTSAQNRVAADKAAFAAPSAVQPQAMMTTAQIKQQLASAGYTIATPSSSQFTAAKTTATSSGTSVQTLVVNSGTNQIMRSETRLDGRLVMSTARPTTSSGSRTVTVSVAQ